MHELNFHIIRFSYGSNTHDVVGRGSYSRAAFDIATTAASSWILAATASKWILAATASKWILAATASSGPSRPELHHSSLTFRPGILAATVVTSSWRASPAVGNASVDDTAAASTFFFTTNSKIFMHPFNCYIRNTSKC
jgi:hypothetical protein